MYLVTGGSGFIGSEVVRELVAAGKNVVVFCRSGSSERLAGLEGDVKVVRGDIDDRVALQDTVARYKVSNIIHLAFCIDIAELEVTPGKGIEANCQGFINVLEAARSGNVNKVVWTSSAAVYGEQDRYKGLPVNEESPFYPLNVYGMYKVFCESLGEHYHHKLGVKNIALRPTIVFGSGRYFRGAATFAYDLFHGPAADRPISLERGDQLVDFLYVKDLAKSILLAVQSENLQHRAFNICGHLSTIREAAAVVCKINAAAQIEVQGGQLPMMAARLDTTKAEQELLYKPSYSLEAAFRECMEEVIGRYGRH